MAMRKGVLFVIFTGLVGLFAGCGNGGGNASNAVSSDPETAAKIEKAVAAAPTRGSLLELETKAMEAWKKGDMAFWESALDASYVGFTGGKRVDKAGELQLLADGKCEIGSYAFSNESMVPVGNDAIVLTANLTAERKCGGQPLPSPVTAATLYVRSGAGWKAAYHNEIAILDLNAPKVPPPAKPEAPKKNAGKPAQPSKSDAFTDELFAVESRVWDAWKAKDRSAMEQQLSQDLTLVDSTGTVTVGKNAVIDGWMLPNCDIKSAAPSEGIATQISPVVGILTFKGNAAGTCEGQPLANFWGTSIFLKEAGEWKIVYTTENPV